MSDHSFRLPEGAEYVGADGDNIVMRVEIPLDDDGFFGRQCPSCSQVFRVAHDDYEALPDDLRLWCVYCGHNEDHGEFLTSQQEERIMRPLGDVAVQMVGQMFDDVFGGLSRQPSHGEFISVSWSYRSTPYYPEPLPDIDEEKLIRQRSCETCAIRYAVFGEHRFCPVCGLLPPIVVARDALAAELARLDVLSTLPSETAAALREQGVFDRIHADTIKNLVTIVETLARDTFCSAVPNADAILKGRGNIFQRLDDMAALFQAHTTSDLRATVGEPTWSLLESTWAARHIFGHRDGIVDDRYLAQVPTATVSVGQRLTVAEASVRDAIGATTTLCEAITNASPSDPSATTRT